ncbi:nicotinate phosphoribosyltransferase [Pseudomonas nitritireducens]|uniref:Nicotinate phosphoribosyltransferase n=1 Tax=Pseudomonas nitroreducens TaxID=46680 RepID=A0A7W7KQJ7_PSENT|nr:nicotinate phosphoribosyltransferase [Pseudomonas nitritireducens]MBB4866836.1 nicotinate phosphoribosyltransferase [Pseudomonas nitritireducens]
MNGIYFKPDECVMKSLLDTDFYQITMGQAIQKLHSSAQVVFRVTVRTKGEDLRPLIKDLREQVDMYGQMRFREDELRFLFSHNRSYLKADYKDFLSIFQPQAKMVKISESNGQIDIRASGSWFFVQIWEIAILAMLSEIRNKAKYPDVTFDMVNERLYNKIDWLKQNADASELAEFKLSDFGTRRRLSYEAQHTVVDILRKDFPGVLTGTSNVHLARELNLNCIGTMAHQWIMGHQQAGGARVQDHQKVALENWARVYRGELGIALTDTISSDAFLRDFDLYFAKLFDGLRHDSGDPVAWAEKMIAHYEKLRIDPKTKTLIFSDGLDFKESLRIIRALKGRINMGFGIGTNLTCDVEGVTPLSVVMKMTSMDGQPVAKISDNPEKAMCEDEGFLNYLGQTFGVKLPTKATNKSEAA